MMAWRTSFFCLLAFLFFASPAYADITIAAVGPITGQDATTGEQMQRGAEAAVAAINASGGVLGQTLRLMIKDDVCDPKQSVAIANQLAGQDVAAVIGPMCSGSAIPASKIYNEERMLMISPSATSPTLTDQGFDAVFRTCGRDDQQGSIVAAFMASHYTGKNIAILHDKTSYGQGIADQVRKNLGARGMHEKLYESISRGERDYGSLIAKLKENAIDVVFFGGYHTEAGLIVRQMRDQNMGAIFIGGDDLATKELWSITGAAGNGMLMSFNTDPRGKPEAAQAVQTIRASGFDPEGMTLYTYAAVQVAVESIKRAGMVDATKMAQALRKDAVSTVIGTLSFDAHGDVTKPDYILYRWSNGAYTPVEEP